MSESNAVAYIPGLGLSIDRTAAEAIILATKHGVPITYKHNDFEVTAYPITEQDVLEIAKAADRQRDKIVAAFNADMAAKSAAYRKSPAYAVDFAIEASRIVTCQNAVDSCMAKLNDTIRKGEAPLLVLLSRLTENADVAGVRFDHKRLIRVLERFGYRADDMIDLPKDSYRNKRTAARFIVGSALACLKMGFPPHPMTVNFVAAYLKL